jgi:hypothetical protein
MPWVDVHTEVEIRLTRSCFRTYKAGSRHNVPRHVAGKIVYLKRAGTFTELDTLGRPLRKGASDASG